MSADAESLVEQMVERLTQVVKRMDAESYERISNAAHYEPRSVRNRREGNLIEAVRQAHVAFDARSKSTTGDRR
ncbi:Uncharacterised protein [Mycobacteroides abscessus subsp. bolletii]|nr:Uncharacterised protein [Mycobacteroides abscessus subsp. bolletii]SHY73158.1 Uncharacterised protein [Mycobacteroides abscessus subsp. bolletii]